METELNQVREPKFLPRQTRYAVGLDLGQANDPTAVTILEKVTGVLDSGSDWERHCGLSAGLQTPDERIYLVHLERLPLRLSYVTVADRVGEIMAREPLCRGENQKPAELVIDQTGPGASVGDIFVDRGLRPIRITITGGTEATCVGQDRWNVSKTLLVSKLDAALHTKLLRFADDLEGHEVDALVEELENFKRTRSEKTGNPRYGAREGKHDDLLLATAIACWWITRPPAPTAQWTTWGYKQR
jgi:hypothetical protein